MKATDAMTATEVIEAHRLLFGDMPSWAKEAFFHCPVVNRTISACATNGSTTEETAWRVAELLYQDRNNYRDSLMQYARNSPLHICASPTDSQPAKPVPIGPRTE